MVTEAAARAVALALLRPYVERGDTIEQIRYRQEGYYGPESAVEDRALDPTLSRAFAERFRRLSPDERDRIVTALLGMHQDGWNEGFMYGWSAGRASAAGGTSDVGR